jgi:hypothetical protein
MLRIVPSLLFLLAPAAAAQSSVTLAPTQDTFLQDVNPASNFGASPDLWFGRGSFFGLGNVRTLVQFPLNGLPTNPAQIRSAKFSVWQHNTEAAAGGLPCELHAATSAWTELGATWNNQPTYDPQVYASADVGDSFYRGWISWDATALVRDHAIGVRPNLGWFFRMQFETAGASRLGYFHSREYLADPSRRPMLNVEYYELGLQASVLTAGQPGTLTANDAAPGGRVFFALSPTGFGSFAVPNFGVTLELDQPMLVGSAFANGVGVAFVNFMVPPGAAGRSAWCQACAQGVTSNVVATTVM